MSTEEAVMERPVAEGETAGAKPALPRVLFVDDEPNVLQGIRRQLRRDYDVTLATSGAEGLQIIAAADEPFPVVVSDMRMPEMNGAQFLEKVREASPDTQRVILTGQADMESTIDAVNKGQIFRFLTKPCDTDSLKAVLESGHEQYRLLQVERELLEDTVSGAVKTLTEVLAMANPAAGLQASRISRYVEHMLQATGRDEWQVRLAGMLSQIGCVTMPRQTLDKVNAGTELSDEEQQLYDAHYQVAASLIRGIPRLEEVAEMILLQGQPEALSAADGNDLIQLGAALVMLATDFDQCRTRGSTPPLAVDEVAKHHPGLSATLQQALKALLTLRSGEMEPRMVGVRDLATGMVLDQDLLAANGVCLCSAGQTVSGALLQRIHTIAERIGVEEPFRVLVAG